MKGNSMAFDHRQDSEEVMHEINMTPLVDVMLVLLVVFMITVPVVQHGVKVQLPQASSEPQPQRGHSLQLSVDSQGRFFLDQQAVAAPALEARLREQARLDPQAQLNIRGDQKVAYAHVAQAMAAAQRAGLAKIGFVTQAPRP